MRELGDLPGDLHAGRAAADDGEREPGATFGLVLRRSSAISNAPKIRVRNASASSTVFMVGACGANSGWPK